MKSILTLLTICISCISVYASHILGGYIAAKQVTGLHYQITAVVQSDPNSPSNNQMADIELNFGDGTKETVSRATLATENNVQRNIYVVHHTYAADGEYMITYTDPNWAANIVNLNGGFSDIIPVKLQCWINVKEALTNQQSANPLAYEQVKGRLNHPLHYNPTFVRADGDDIYIELLAERSDLTNFNLPQNSIVNAHSGMLTFTPAQPGLFLFVFRIHTSKNGIETSQTDMMQLIQVLDGVAASPTVEVINATLFDQGWYGKAVTPNEQLSQSVLFTLTNNPFSAEVYSELTDKGATTTIVNTALNQRHAKLDWTALPSYQRNTPYFITYRYRSSADNYIDDYNVAVYFGAPFNTGLNDNLWNQAAVKVYPNPVIDGTCTLLIPDNRSAATVSIYDALGRVVYTSKVNNQQLVLKTYTWPTGMYSYRVLTSNGLAKTGIFIVQ
jgi:hypothetical protein